MQILSPALDVLNHKLWGWGWPSFVLTGLPGDSDVCSSIKNHWPRRPGRGLLGKGGSQVGHSPAESADLEQEQARARTHTLPPHIHTQGHACVFKAQLYSL